MRAALKERFERESESVSALRDEFLVRVVRWVYSSEELWTYPDLREKGSEDSILPGPAGAFYAYGFDSAGHRIMIRQFRWESVWVSDVAKGPGSPPELRRVPTTDTVREYLIKYEGDCLHVSELEHESLKSAHRLQFQDGLLLDSQSFESGSYSRQHFFYEGRRKKKQECFADNERLTMEIHYGPHGEQTLFRVRRDGTLYQLGQPLPKGITPKTLKEAIRERLLLLIPQVVEKAKIDEPIYCVTLGYDGEGNDPLPPLLGIGIESERRRWTHEHGTEARDWVWNLEEFYHFEKAHTQLEDDALEESCDLLNNHLAQRDSFAPAVVLLVEVAGELNRIVWPPTIRKTPDFLVYAVDFEMGSLRKNMRAILSPQQFADLKARAII